MGHEDRSKEVMDFLREQAREISVKQENGKAHKTSMAKAREVLFLEQYEEVAKKVFSKRIPTVKKQKKTKKKPTKRILNLMLSDLHYGAMLDKNEVGHRYGPIEESRRTAYIAQEAADYKRQYRDETELYVHLMGDIIQNQLHDPRDGAPLAEQVACAQHVLIQAIDYLASEFPNGVTVFCTSGNHGRNAARHHNRATNQKWDSIETMLYLGVRSAFFKNPRVKFVIPKTPYYTYTAFDKKGLMTHGDTVINPGYPGKSINVNGVKNQINAINAAMGQKVNEEYSLFGVGHVHTGSVTHLSGKTIFVSNGCLIPTDAYALSTGIFECNCGQWMWESVPGYIFGDSRFVSVDFETDAMKELDTIIVPYEDFSKSG